MDRELQHAAWVLILNGRIRREQLRVELENTPRIRWRRRRTLRTKLDETITNLAGLLSMAGEPKEEDPWSTS